MFDFRSICKLLKFYHLKFGIKTRYFFDDFLQKNHFENSASESQKQSSLI